MASSQQRESGLLVLDEFLSFVDEVSDVDVGALPPSAFPLPEPVPLEQLDHTKLHSKHDHLLFDQSDAHALFHAMQAVSTGSDGHDTDQMAGGENAPLQSTPTDPPPVKKKRRRRQKEELDYLRVRVAEMEAELTRLRGEDIASSAIAVGTARALYLLPATTIDLLPSGDESDDTESGGALAEKATTSFQLWERIAKHQKEATQKAVMENIRLRALLEGQLSVARSLETALRKKPRFAAAELNPYLGKGSTIRLDGADEQKIYESIGLELDVQYAQVDAVLQSSGIVDVLKEKIFGAEVRADETGMFLEHKESRVMPSDVHAVGRAVWQTLGRESMPLRSGVYIAREATDDTVCAKVVDTFKLPKATTEIVVTIRLVLKRFVEEARVVSVWESMVETVGPICLRLREKAWNVLRPHSVVDSNGEEKQMCLAQSIIRVWPEVASTEVNENTEVGTLTNLVVGSYQRNLGIMAQIIQNLLREEARKQAEEGLGSP